MTLRPRGVEGPGAVPVEGGGLGVEAAAPCLAAQGADSPTPLQLRVVRLAAAGGGGGATRVAASLRLL